MSLQYKIIFLFYRVGLSIDEIAIILNYECKASGYRKRPYKVCQDVVLNEMKTIEMLRKNANTPLKLRES